MSILICTPAYGGQVHLPHFHSCLNLKEEFIKAGIEHDWLTTAHESLIPRARNTMLSTFMKTDYDTMFFIDADIEFTPEDVSKLWNMLWDEDRDIAVAAYPMKRLDTPLSAWKDNKLVEITDETEAFQVQYAGTGFMMMKRTVLQDLIDAYPELEHEEGHVGRCWALFDTMIWNDIYLSEDYAFCHRARKQGKKIWCDPTIKLIHHGQYAYGA